ncbi:hypothetical protein [Sunxiuqinia dokdonensis]|uniref:Uncharacterized protein n=1 Tax=Sunxiuqinia dokdonensis TaxID=1409788 RepID=A0A0L8V3L2_9BACT|nr:hypothetical protein [Sunxiuqinia dokdonensis]KOH43016.1 hypothetical protein NC99_41490 [Sunxiuqinia dokdonensis]
MRLEKNHIPLYQQFIHRVHAGLQLLDEESRQEVVRFVVDRQHRSGGFMDRGEQPDLYYSLFGFWLASALELRPELEHLKEFVRERKEETNPVDRFALMLLQQAFFEKKEGRLQFFRELLKNVHPVNFSYQLFLFLLVFDARYGKKGWLYFFVRLLLRWYQPPVGAPCSLLAALTVARGEVGLPSQKMQQQLLAYFKEDIGFRAFEQVETGDMLSMGVSLFALQKTGFDLRLIAPTCFDFIQQNFDRGAFLSGDGDLTRDLEYTFYGLLALGSLADD